MGAEVSRRTTLQGIFAESVEELAAANIEEKDERREPSGPVRSMALTLGKMEDEAKALQAALVAGQHVQEIDTDLIDDSFVRDRIDEIAFVPDDPFVQSIAEHGQEVPILVRSSPSAPGRYQVAYGHRRLKAARVLGRKVRAVVREISDDQLVIAQGVENSARSNLSYIERAVFAFELEQRSFGRQLIMQALSTDKTELSKLISTASAIPKQLILKIGSAPGIGRRKWMAFASAYDAKRSARLDKLAATPAFLDASSDERFEQMFAVLVQKERDAQVDQTWKPSVGGPLEATIKSSGRGVSFAFKAEDASAFSGYLVERLDELYAEFVKAKSNTGD